MFDDEEFETRMKNEIAPVISNHLEISLQLLNSFSVEILNKILTSINIVPDEDLRKIIIRNASHPEKIPDLIDEALGFCYESQSTSIYTYDECVDLRAGILAIAPNDIRDEVEKKINEINDIDRLSELSQKPINEILTELGIKSEELETEVVEEYNEKRDIIAGILAMVPDESLKEEIEEKLNEIEDTQEIIKLATMEYTDFLRELGLESNISPAGQPLASDVPGVSIEPNYSFTTPINTRPVDIKDDMKAGILARLPPSVRTFLEDKIMEINDIEKLIKLSTMNYLQIQNEFGIPVSSPALAPPSVINPIDTTARREKRSSESSETPQSQQHVEFDEQTQERLRQRNEEIKRLSEHIIKIVEKTSGKDIPENFDEKKKILTRIFPDRLKRLVEIFKKQKKKKRIILLFEWFVLSQRIEEIETYVEHWQGAGADGAGGFRASIGVSRYDTIIEHLKDNELNQIITTAKMALNKIHDPNIQVRAVGVEEIKSIANILLHRVR
ncbi:MAG: hypothetical protein ACTSPY_12990 [Candidatus Helarchaeota archaeon]